MGEQNVSDTLGEKGERDFMRALLADVQALEMMLENGQIESGHRRIGAEQEMFLVDREMYPAPVAVEVLKATQDDRLTTELARFNLEANTAPHRFEGRCLYEMEQSLCDVVEKASWAAETQDAKVLLSGILPTISRKDLTLDNMTPSPRYRALNDTIRQMRGDDFQILIKGVDELHAKHDNLMFEACNTSFQIHFQVGPEEFAQLYNVAQLVTAPVLAAAVNSPLFLSSRLWKETRVALFGSAVDDRSSARQARGFRPRVTFGDSWVNESVLEIFRQQIARFRVVLASPPEEDPLEVLKRGEIPELSALRLHNGTIYRWNRACYGVQDGVAHLRIENRVLPSGPTIVDEVANAAFFFGLMGGIVEEVGDPKDSFDFDHAKDNFYAAARFGLKAQFHWFDGETLTAADLIRKRLLPLARKGLVESGIDTKDIDRYLGVIEDRVTSGQTGSSWMLQSLKSMKRTMTVDMSERRLTEAIYDNQRVGKPVHTWSVCATDAAKKDEAWRRSYRRVGQFMTKDLFTVRPTDLVDLAASVMEWEHIRHVPVEDDDGALLGLVSHRRLVRLIARGGLRNREPVIVRDIMIADPIAVTPETPTLEAMQIMRENQVGCLPVIEDAKLVGLITEADLINVSSRLLEAFLADEEGSQAG